MELRDLGKTGIKVSRLGIGTAALGRPAYINLGHAEDLQRNYDQAEMEARTHQVLEAAYAAGIRYFDTARSYGLGEQFMGNWLKTFNPKEISVGSKWGYYYVADWEIEAEVHEVKDHSLGRFQQQWLESEQHLGSHIDLYQVHSATLESGILTNSAVHHALQELKEQMGIRIGLSLSGAQQAEVLEEAMNIFIDGQRLFDAVQATYNVLETSAERMLQTAHEAGMGVIIKEAVANGRLTSRNQEEPFVSDLKQMAWKHQVGMDAIALAFVLHQDWADVVLSGASTVAHLESNVLANSVRLDQEDMDLLRAMAMGSEDYWGKRKSLSWN
ncbi:aldo/keto reductase [Persicobacter sp. CCB-QB2]|uniref:aldo/keto reductase n=1 Tax=Persicobacter sp. CCB-QB2 TaxID=1561025 RepID=UPI0006A9FFB2|nr:aldo/keto reductase [Persicobacter sp. CCB-QB2]